MTRLSLKKRRATVWTHRSPLYSRVLAPVRQAFSDLEWKIEPLDARPGDWMARLVRELSAPWTPLCLFPIRYRDLPPLVRRGWLRPLDGALRAGTLAACAPQALQLASSGGRLYGFPDDVTPYTLMVRQDKLREHRLAPPTSWLQLERQLQYFANAQRPVIRVQEGGPALRYGFLLALLGSNSVDFTQGVERMLQAPAAAVQAYEWMRRMVAQRRLTYPASLYRETPQTLDLFRDGRLIYCVGWPSTLMRWPVELQQKIRLLPFPRGPALSRPCIPLAGSAWCVPHNTAALDAALEALRAIAENTRAFELEGGAAFPAQRALWRDPEILRRKPIYRDAAATLETSSAYTADYLDADLQQLEETFREALAADKTGEEWLKTFRAGSRKLARQAVTHHTVKQALEFIDANLATLADVRQLAAAVGRNPDYMNRLFQRELQQTCGAYITRRRMERAKELLLDVTRSIKEIAHRLGFSRTTSFSRAFRHHWGCSAVVMRRRELARVHGR